LFVSLVLDPVGLKAFWTSFSRLPVWFTLWKFRIVLPWLVGWFWSLLLGSRFWLLECEIFVEGY